VFTLIDGIGEGPSDQAQSDHWVQVTKAADGTSAGVVKLLREMDPLYQRAAVIMALPRSEFEEQIKPFNIEIQQSSNPFVPIAFAAIGKARAKEFAILAELAMVRTAIILKMCST
jgi:hypothetical protein